MSDQACQNRKERPLLTAETGAGLASPAHGTVLVGGGGAGWLPHLLQYWARLQGFVLLTLTDFAPVGDLFFITSSCIICPLQVGDCGGQAQRGQGGGLQQRMRS